MSKILSSLTTAALAVGLLSTAHAQTWPGHNAGGYVASDIAFHYTDMSDATQITSGDDNWARIALPFDFTLNGYTSQQLWVSTNGIVGLDPANAGSYCCSGNSGLDKTIAIAHMDWVDSVSSKVVGTGSNQSLVLQWRGQEFGSNGAVDMQMVLHDGSNNIEFQYLSLEETRHVMYTGLGDPTGDFGYFSAAANYSQKGLLISAVPEPASMALMLAGLGGLGGLGLVRRRRNAA